MSTCMNSLLLDPARKQIARRPQELRPMLKRT
jgi:hypothetical protein